MNNVPVLKFIYFKFESGNEPVKKWLENRKKFTEDEEEAIFTDINAVCQDWELCLKQQLVKDLKRGLWEIRTRLRNRIVRVFFTREDNLVVLLHGIVKKTQKIPPRDLRKARRQRNLWLNG